MTTSGFRYHIAGHSYTTAEEVAADYDRWWLAWEILSEHQPVRVAAELFSLRFVLPPDEQQDLIDALVSATDNRAELEEARRIERQQG